MYSEFLKDILTKKMEKKNIFKGIGHRSIDSCLIMNNIIVFQGNKQKCLEKFGRCDCSNLNHSYD